MEEKRRTITVRLDETLHRAIRMKVAREDITITDYILDLVREDLKKG